MSTEIEVGMNGSQVRNLINSNFDTLESIDRFISVTEYGAVGDGETNDRIAIKNCIEAANGRTIYFPPGNYKITGGLTVITEDPVMIYGENAVLIGDSLSNGVGVLAIQSIVGSADLLLADAVSGDYLLTPTTPASFVTGDFILIKDDVILRSLNGNNIYNGELLQILSITDGQIRLHNPVLGNYSVSENIRISKVNRNPVIIYGLTIIGDTGSNKDIQGIQTINRNNVTIFNNIISKCGLGGINITGCLNGFIFNNKAFDCYKSGNGYGINVNASKNISVYSNNVTECRHCIVTGGSYPNYHVNIFSNILSSSTVVLPASNGAISTHYFDYFLTIRDNVIFGDGIFAVGRSCLISGNTIYATEPSQLGIGVYFHPQYKPSVVIENNHLVRLRDDIAGSNGIYLDVEKDNVTVDKIIIQNNTIDGFNQNITLSVSGLTGFKINNLVIKDNNFYCNAAINDFVSNDIEITTAVIEGNIFKSPFNFVVDSIGSLSFKNNRMVQSIAGKLLYLSAITHAIVSGNVFDSNTDDESVTIANITTLIFTDNIIKNNTGANAILLDTVTNLVNQGNSIDNCSNAISKVSITNDQSGTNFTY